ncbi:hypothetical protein GGQ84_002555 [Desulfitispora alkaliphila]|uniref:hypothetical protein n=1 Tax=Desulfitispora alkaliphila TaxID=622674 RepID=UPI003D20BE14
MIDEKQDIAPRYSYIGMQLPLYWGLIGNEEIVSVKTRSKNLEMSEANIVANNEISFFYIVATEPLKGWGGINLTAYNKCGDILATY